MAPLIRPLQCIVKGDHTTKAQLQLQLTYLDLVGPSTLSQKPSASTITSQSLIAFSSQTLHRLLLHLAESLRTMETQSLCEKLATR